MADRCPYCGELRLPESPPELIEAMARINRRIFEAIPASRDPVMLTTEPIQGSDPDVEAAAEAVYKLMFPDREPDAE